MRKFHVQRVAILALGAAAALGFAACSNLNTTSPGTKAHVYAVASHNGNVYQIDDTTKTASSAALLSTTQNATGELVFHKGIGYIAVAAPFSGSNAPGLYRFDPANPAAGATKIAAPNGSAISAAYLAFASDTLAYVTSADFGSLSSSDGLYSFNPSNPSLGLTKIVSLPYPQDVAIGADGRVYVAENNLGSGTKVARLNALGTAIEAEIICTKTGPTGLLAGTFNGVAGIFVGNIGPSDPVTYAYTGGSVDFIATTALGGSTATAVVTGPVVSRMALLDATTLIASGGYPAKTFGFDPTVAAPLAVEVKYGPSSASFGGGDIAVYNGTAYVPDGTKTVYAFSSVSGPVSAITVGASGDLITNIGIDN